jgi:uncharacterized protein YggE
MSVRRSRSPLVAAVTVLGVLAAVAVLGRPEPVRAEPVDPSTATVQVEGVGTATGTPDVLRVTIGAETTAETVAAALSGTDAAIRRVHDALRAEGVPEDDVRTVNLAVHPAYGGDGQQIVGYTARHDLDVTLRDLSRAGAQIGLLVDAGGDAARLQGVAFWLEDDAALQAEARAAAFAAARGKAEQYAELTGRALGEVVEVREQSTPSEPVPYATDARGGEAVPLSPGTATVAVTAQVRWSLR